MVKILLPYFSQLPGFSFFAFVFAEGVDEAEAFTWGVAWLRVMWLVSVEQVRFVVLFLVLVSISTQQRLQEELTAVRRERADLKKNTTQSPSRLV